MTHPDKHNPAHGGRRNRLIREHEHDSYRGRSKPPEPAACPDCNAVFHEGRWQWGDPATDAHEIRCPACARIHDRLPAGYLTVTGGFQRSHRGEILELARNIEEREQREHPLKRIMGVLPEDNRLEITFTDPHLARGVGEALHRAYQGELDYHYTEEGNLLQVSWHRDD